MTTRTVFPIYKVNGKKSGVCPHCGKRASRSQVFQQSLNPFNKNADGYVKSVAEILDECKVRRDAWLLLPTFHASCEYEVSKNKRNTS